MPAVQSLSVTATYRERIALRPDAVLEASIIDVSLADVVAQTVASVRIENPGSPPFSFDIPYEPNAIDERNSYNVRVSIRAGDELIFATDTAFPVLTRGAGREVDILLRAVARSSRSRAALAPLPATFQGELPCADCPGVVYQLNLFDDGAFYLKRTYRDRGDDAVVGEIGAWQVSPDGSTIGIWGDGEAPTQFRIVDDTLLRLLDRNGQDIQSSLNYDLSRAAGVLPLDLTLQNMRGTYQYLADAGLFSECLSGRRFAVAHAGANAVLERAYLAARQQPGAPLLVSFDGRLTERPPMEGEGLQPTVVVEALGGVWPAETCGARMSTSELLDTNWVLTRLGNEPVVIADGMRGPRMVLRSGGDRVTGSSGCNTFNGGYQISGRSVTFAGIAATMRACLEGGEIEQTFFDALDHAVSLRHLRHHLELFDAAGALLARFEARQLD